MNPYEAKLEARRERLENAAQRAEQEANAAYQRSRAATEHIPFGQPILVGHHSEGRHRAALKRSHQAMGKCVERSKDAEHLTARAAAVGTGGISADDPEAVVKLRGELAECKRLQEAMKAANKIFRSAELSDEEKVRQSMALGISERSARGALKPTWGKPGIESWALSNNSANIRRIKGRIEQLLAEAARRPEEPTTVHHTGFSVTEDPDDNRILVAFPARVSTEVCSLLKRHGFRWAPSRGAWSRQLNGNSRSTVQYLAPTLEKLLEG